ncbi:hypothetical protein POMI540_1350 [Schizosaccharomyces pombe]|nr:uncharacterized protein SPAC1002.01 [Schizosaccharomyces pombe]Q9US57.2 RecName: Full=Uncharacterized protein C1002.01 [Schizosaccharomyces pombe 972h-]CAB90312.2 conserved fungal protein [Schizosaccharomyces pombe]|eukprot:NP_001342961.1 uncharacterized protein SPAC1002.01 [Schizosaccharomyces pombe]
MLPPTIRISGLAKTLHIPSRSPLQALKGSFILLNKRKFHYSPFILQEKVQSSNHTIRSDTKLWKRLLKITGKQAHQFKDKPFSHIFAFLFLHELSAILPLPIFFFIFHSLDWTPTGLPGEYLQKGSHVAASIFAKLGYNLPLEKVSKTLLDGAAAYAVVKVSYFVENNMVSSTRPFVSN